MMAWNEKTDVAIAVVVGVALAFLIAIGNLYLQLGHLRTEMGTLHDSILKDVSKIADSVSQSAATRRPATVVAAEPSRKVIDSIKEELAEELTATKRQAPPRPNTLKLRQSPMPISSPSKTAKSGGAFTRK